MDKSYFILSQWNQTITTEKNIQRYYRDWILLLDPRMIDEHFHNGKMLVEMENNMTSLSFLIMLQLKILTYLITLLIMEKLISTQILLLQML